MTTLHLQDHREDAADTGLDRFGIAYEHRQWLAAAWSAARPWCVTMAVHVVLVAVALGGLWALAVPRQSQASGAREGLTAGAASPASDALDPAATEADPPMHRVRLASAGWGVLDLPEPLRHRSRSALPAGDTAGAANARMDARPDAGGDGAMVMAGVNWLGGVSIKAPPSAMMPIGASKQEADRLVLQARTMDSAGAGRAGPYGVPLCHADEPMPRSVVVVVDATGSMIDRLGSVTREVGRWVATGVSHRQLFTVVVYRGEGLDELRPTGLKEATTSTRADAVRWMSALDASGRAACDAALERALSYRPSAVVLIRDGSSGPEPAGQALAQRVSWLLDTASRGARLSVIEVGDGESAEGSALAEVARASGGSYRHVGDAPAGKR